MKINRKKLNFIRSDVLSQNLKSFFLKEKGIEKNFRKNGSTKERFYKLNRGEIAPNDCFLFFKGFFENFFQQNYFLEGKLEVEILHLPLNSFRMEVFFSFLEEFKNFQIGNTSPYHHNSNLGAIQKKGLLISESSFFIEGETLKIILFLPFLKNYSRILAQEVFFYNSTKIGENVHINCSLFSIDKCKKKYFKNGQCFSESIWSNQIGIFSLNLSDSNLFLVKINMGPEYRFHERKG